MVIRNFADDRSLSQHAVRLCGDAVFPSPECWVRRCNVLLPLLLYNLYMQIGSIYVFRSVNTFMRHTKRPPSGGGGGGTSICMHIGYVPRERPPFPALNFRSGAYHFHKLPKIRSGALTVFHFFGGFCRSGDHHFQIFFNFNRFIASYGWLSPNAKRLAAPRVSSRPESASQTRPGIFTLKTDQARSGAPHFHARPGARSGALTHFSLSRGTYLPKFGVNTPPPPRGATLLHTIIHIYWYPPLIAYQVGIYFRVMIKASHVLMSKW